jgi:hypothetical protein
MDMAEHIATVLSPHLGANTAESAARHLLAKHGIGEGPVPPQQLQPLRDALRRGLVAFVGAERADELAARCLEPFAPE